MMADTNRAPVAQLDRYVELGYPALAGMTEGAFRAWLEPLTSPDAAAAFDPEAGRIATLMVIRQRIVAADRAMERVQVRGRAGYVDMNPSDPGTFHETEAITTPAADAYLVHGFDSGDDYRDQPPSAVLPQLLGGDRSPVTIDEALAAVVLHPELVARKHAFSILGSRSTAAQVTESVPAIWISRGAPRLGWCWDNNPHTWLGSASCAGRSAPS
jgi:hypothetical protein